MRLSLGTMHSHHPSHCLYAGQCPSPRLISTSQGDCYCFIKSFDNWGHQIYMLLIGASLSSGACSSQLCRCCSEARTRFGSIRPSARVC